MAFLHERMAIWYCENHYRLVKWDLAYPIPWFDFKKAGNRFLSLSLSLRETGFQDLQRGFSNVSPLIGFEVVRVRKPSKEIRDLVPFFGVIIKEFGCTQTQLSAKKGNYQ